MLKNCLFGTYRALDLNARQLLTVCHPLRSNFGPIQKGDWATFSAVSDTRCSTYLIFTAFLTVGDHTKT